MFKRLRNYFFPEPTEGEREDARLHALRLEKAAGISRVGVICHIDTWRFIDDKASQKERYTKKEPQQRDDGLAEVVLSGPDVVAILSRMREVRHGAVEPDRPIAKRVYVLVAEAVDAVDLDARDGVRLPPVVIDAGSRAPEAGQDQAGLS